MRHAQLRAFHNVAIHGGFSNAATALGLTQPAISDQVRKLETEYDVRLFDRQNRQTTLTQSGEKLLEITHRLFEVETLAREFLTRTRSRQSGTLKIIADSARHMLPILGAFRKKHPRVKISLRTGNSSDVLENLHTYHADIGVLGEMPDTGKFDAINLGAAQLVAFASTEEAKLLAPAGKMTMRQLADSPLVLREPGSKTRAKFEAHATRMGIKISAHIEVEGREAVREIVAAAGGIGIVSQAEFGDDPRFEKITITDARIVMDEALICLSARRDSSLIRIFMKDAAGLVGGNQS